MSQQLFYIGAAGLNATMDRLAATTNNLANTNTIGFKAQRPVFQAQPYYGQGLPDRVNVAAREDTSDLRAGAIEQTGRSLDVAINGPGWIAVQAPDGSVGLTRNGSLSIAASGLLQTSDGRPVLGEGLAPISLPPLRSLTIGEDGTISGTLAGQEPDQVTTLNRVLLANPNSASLRRGPDGLFRDPAGAPAPDAAVRLHSGALEGSNADPVALMMALIEHTRMYEMQTQLLRASAQAGQGQATPLSLS